MALTSNGCKLLTLPELVLTADPKTLLIYEFDLAAVNTPVTATCISAPHAIGVTALSSRLQRRPRCIPGPEDEFITIQLDQPLATARSRYVARSTNSEKCYAEPKRGISQWRKVRKARSFALYE